jgi:hypothetical protein
VPARPGGPGSPFGPAGPAGPCSAFGPGGPPSPLPPGSLRSPQNSLQSSGVPADRHHLAAQPVNGCTRSSSGYDQAPRGSLMGDRSRKTTPGGQAPPSNDHSMTTASISGDNSQNSVPAEMALLISSPGARRMKENSVRYGAGRQVSIGRDGQDFVVAFQPENYVIFRGDDPNALRKVCRQLRWETVMDTAPADKPAA